MSLNLRIIQQLLADRLADERALLSTILRCILNGLHDEGCVLSVLRGTPSIVLQIFHMCNDYKATLRNIDFVVEYAAKSMCTLHQEYLQALQYVGDDDIMKALQQWHSFVQIHSSRIQMLPQLALNEPLSSYVFMDTNFIKMNKTKELNEPKGEIYPLYWVNKPRKMKVDPLRFIYSTEECFTCSSTSADGNIVVGCESSMNLLHNPNAVLSSTLHLFEMNTGAFLQQIKLDCCITAIAFATNSELWTGDIKGFLYSCDMISGAIVWKSDLDIEGGSSIHSLLCLDEETLVCGTWFGTLALYSVATRTLSKQWSVGTRLSAVAYHSDRGWLLTSGSILAEGNEIRFWSTEGTLMGKFDIGTYICGIAVHPTNPDVVACVLGVEGELQQFDISKNVVITSTKGVSARSDTDYQPCYDVSYVENGEKLVCASEDGNSVFVVNIMDGTVVNKIREKRQRKPDCILNSVQSIHVIPNSNRVLIAGSYGCSSFTLPEDPDLEEDEDEEEVAMCEIISCCILHNGEEFMTLSRGRERNSTLSRNGKLTKWSLLTYDKISQETLHACPLDRYATLTLHPTRKIVALNAGSKLLWLKTDDLTLVSQQDDPDYFFISHISIYGKTCLVQWIDGESSVTVRNDISDLYNVTTLAKYESIEECSLMLAVSKDLYRNGQLVTCSTLRGLQFWYMGTNQMYPNTRCSTPLCGRIVHARFLSKPDRVMCVDSERKVHFYPVGDREGYHRLFTLSCTLKTHSSIFVASNLYVVTGNDDDSLQVHAAWSGEVLHTFFHFWSEGFTCFDVDMERGFVIAASRSGRCYVLRTELK